MLNNSYDKKVNILRFLERIVFDDTVTNLGNEEWIQPN